MPVAVNQPQRREKEADPLDTIIKGLSIASTIYGIKDASEKRDLLAKQNSISEERLNQQSDRDVQRLDLDRQRLEQEKLRNDRDYSLKKNEYKDPFKRLPEDQKHVVTDLSKKNASKIAIANQIDATMSGWDNLADDQKVAQGRTLLKVLNSAEGADAIGSEEAKRLGSKLEYAMGNLFNSNPIQFGRDLPGFKTQAMDQSAAIKKGVGANQSIINDAYGDPNRQTAIGKAVANQPTRGLKEGIQSMSDPMMSSANAASKPTTIQQNGHTYYLNPKTGKYE